jgi:hypothetical protein
MECNFPLTGTLGTQSFLTDFLVFVPLSRKKLSLPLWSLSVLTNTVPPCCSLNDRSGKPYASFSDWRKIFNMAVFIVRPECPGHWCSCFPTVLTYSMVCDKVWHHLVLVNLGLIYALVRLSRSRFAWHSHLDLPVDVKVSLKTNYHNRFVHI